MEEEEKKARLRDEEELKGFSREFREFGILMNQNKRELQKNQNNQEAKMDLHLTALQDSIKLLIVSQKDQKNKKKN